MNFLEFCQILIIVFVFETKFFYVNIFKKIISNLDTIDANSTVEIIPTDSKKSQTSNKNSYSSATLVKKKAINNNNNNNRNLNLLIQHEHDPSAHLSTIESIDINNDNETNDNLDQYEDILDVQVIAKMQEESK